MKTQELIKLLKKNKCYVLRNGSTMILGGFKMSNSTTQQVNVIFGKPGSGKSKIVRNLVKEQNAYAFSYHDTIVPDFCDFNQKHKRL